MDEQIYITIAKVLSNEATDAERQELDAWLSQDAANHDVYENMQRLWEGEISLDGPEFRVDQAWEKVSAKTVGLPEERKPRIIALPAWAKLSAVAAALLIGFVGYFFWNVNTTQTILADNGNRVVVLPDHSTVTLKSGSSLSYPRTFASNERNVSLQGEAFFEVTHNEKQPFVISAQSVNVKVLGTSFDVAAGDTSARVVVATGRVQMTSKQTSESLILTPGKKGLLSSGKLEEYTVTDEADMYWKTGVLNFNGQKLIEVVRAISRAKDTAVSIDPSLSIAQQQQLVTISFRNQSLEQMLTELCLITQTSWIKENNRYIIKPK